MRIRSRLSYANVAATLALFLALGGGTAFALKGVNTVDSGDIKPGNVKTSDLANNAVNSSKASGLGGADITDGSLSGADIGADSITGANVNEASLSGAGITGVDAAKVGGLDAADFAQGGIFTNRVSAAASASDTTVMSLGGYGRMSMDCGAGATSGTLNYNNNTATSMFVTETDNGGVVSEVVPASTAGFGLGAGTDGREYSVYISEEGLPARVVHVDVVLVTGGSASLPNVPDECRAVAVAVVGPAD